MGWLKNAYSRPLFRRAILTRKVSQIDLVLVCDMSVHARSQVSVCSSYDLCHPGTLTPRHTDLDRQHFDQLI